MGLKKMLLKSLDITNCIAYFVDILWYMSISSSKYFFEN